MATIHLLVLNFNGRHLLKECLPTVLRAAAASTHDCQVAVIDNDSADDSVDVLRHQFPAVRLFRCENRGLCSFNTVVPRLDGQVVVLLNNDIKLAPESIDPLVAPLLRDVAASKCFLTAPLCWLFDGQTYEGLQTAFRWRWGLIQALSDYPGHELIRRKQCLTASAGAVMAVDRRKFIEIGGFDPLYLPGRIEDVDFSFRGYLAGYHARYVPESVAYHQGEATFRQEFGAAESQALAVRNTLLFQWKNLRHPWHRFRHLAGLPPRFLVDVMRASLLHRRRRFVFTKAFLAAVRRWRECERTPARTHDARRERGLMKELHWTSFLSETAGYETPSMAGADVSVGRPSRPSFAPDGPETRPTTEFWDSNLPGHRRDRILSRNGSPGAALPQPPFDRKTFCSSMHAH